MSKILGHSLTSEHVPHVALTLHSSSLSGLLEFGAGQILDTII